MKSCEHLVSLQGVYSSVRLEERTKCASRRAWQSCQKDHYVAKKVPRDDDHKNSRQKSIIGLTLIEVLVALAIVGIAMTAIIKAAAQNLRHTSHIQETTMAHWVAQNVLAEAQLGLAKLPEAPGKFAKTTQMLDQEWYWQASQIKTPNRRIQKIVVDVFKDKAASEEEDPLFTLTGYRYDPSIK